MHTHYTLLIICGRVCRQCDLGLGKGWDFLIVEQMCIPVMVFIHNTPYTCNKLYYVS